MPDTRDAKSRNRKVRQEALRDQLSAQGHVQHVVELLDRIADPDDTQADEMLARWKVVLDTKLRLIGKYLPDLKSVEHTGDGSDPITEALNYIRDRDSSLPSERATKH